MADPNGKIVLYDDSPEKDEKPGSEDTASIRVIIFSLFSPDELYAADISQAREVVRPSRVTKVPNTPPFITGVMNLRGRIIPLVDVSCFLGLPERDASREFMVIVTDVSGPLVGLVVEKIADCINIPAASVQAPITTIKGDIRTYTTGIIQRGDRIITLIDLKNILVSDRFKILGNGGE